MRSCFQLLVVSVIALIALSISSAAAAPPPQSQGLQSSDLSRLRSVGAVELSPDGRRIAYSVTMFQISIALAAVSALSRRKAIWYIGLLMAAFGLVYFVDAFRLFF